MKFRIETIKPEHDAHISHIIKTVGEEFGAVGDGYGPGDAEVLNMSQHYTDESRSIYLVGLINDEVVGGCGLATLNDNEDICELRKLFILPESRGLKLGKALTLSCLDYAQSKGYQKCYLETLATMDIAMKMYKKLGFQFLSKPLEGSNHCACNVWMIKTL